MTLALALLLALMPPKAAAHHDRAMDHYTAGRHDEAFAEFHAAYTAMTDPRRDREEREQVLGSLRGMLLVEHERTGAATPLCRLQGLLQDHLATLRAAYPEPAKPREIAGGEERLAEVKGQLAAFPAGACEPTPAEVSPSAPVEVSPPAPPTPTAPTAPAVAPRRAVTPPPAGPPEGPTPKQLRVAGGVTLGIGGALLSVMTFGIVDRQRHIAAAREIDRGVLVDLTREQHAALLDERQQAQARQSLAIATGCAAAGTAALGVALLLVARKGRAAHRRRVSLAPWWLTSGAGLTLRVPLR